ncbi:MAG: MMPL family transporter [Actinomycetota bacterium]|nr:MMPL family transporter [Actinomycetota bacterium]
MNWGKLAHTIRAHPGRMLIIALAILVPPAIATTHVRVTFNQLAELPKSADSVRGYDALSGHFRAGEVAPVILVLSRDGSMWNDESFRAINDLTVALGKVPGVDLVRSITQPTGGVFTEEQLKQAGVGDLLKFPDRLQEGADGVGRIIGGLEQIHSGLEQMEQRLPALADGLSEGADGVAKMRDGIAQMRGGIAQMRAGLKEAADGLAAPCSGSACKESLPSTPSGCPVTNPSTLSGSAKNAELCLKSALDEMHVLVQRPAFDPIYTNVYEDVARAYGNLTGIDDTTNAPPAGDARAKKYADEGGMAGELKTIASGLRRAVDGLNRIEDALSQIDGGLRRLGPGLQDGATGVRTAVAGITRILDGLDQILPGLQRLRAGLAEGAARVRQAGFGDVASAGNLGLTPGLVDAVPGLRKQLGFFMTGDERTTRIFVTLTREPYASESLAAVGGIRAAGALALNKTPLEGTPIRAAGAASFFSDVRTLSDADFRTIMLVVLIGIFVVLALLLRSIVAPVYLILTVLLSFLATLGLTSVVFQGLFGQNGIAWWLPSFLFVMLVALGADYNIFLMSRIREEARVHTTADATARGLALTGHVITSAGIILAGTFAALMAAPLKSLQQFGFAVTVGILMDTFIVRSLLVPSIATLLGRHNWWPSRRAHAP